MAHLTKVEMSFALEQSLCTLIAFEILRLSNFTPVPSEIISMFLMESLLIANASLKFVIFVAIDADEVIHSKHIIGEWIRCKLFERLHQMKLSNPADTPCDDYIVLCSAAESSVAVLHIYISPRKIAKLTEKAFPYVTAFNVFM